MKSGLSITHDTMSGVEVVKLVGYLDGHTFTDLERLIEDLVNAGRTRIVFELSGLSYIASAGVGVFINGQHRARGGGGSLQLVNPNPSVREIFAILGLESLFTIHDNLQAGVRAAGG